MDCRQGAGNTVSMQG